MKKISLKNLNLKEVEQLSREQLKDVMGGASGSDGCPDEKPKCYCSGVYQGCYEPNACVSHCGL